MNSKTINILLIEDNAADARLVRENLAEVSSFRADLIHVQRLAQGLARLAEGGVDVVILDLSLPDSQGPETLVRVTATAEDVPVVILTGQDDDEVALTALQKGAQDYLVKGQLSPGLLARSIRYAIERQRMKTALQSLSIVDELTGLYNRRGLLALGQKQIQIAERAHRGLWLLFLDLDGMKGINDTFGHLDGDRALADTAGVLRQTFRGADILARIGGDEFVVLAVEVRRDSGEILVQRLRAALKEFNLTHERRYKLVLSVGLAHFDAAHPCALEVLLAQADRDMYREKRDHQSRFVTPEEVQSLRRQSGQQ